jgi:Sec-independent protein translocase protein TatA
MAPIAAMFGLFNPGGDEIILILAVFLILLGSDKLPELGKGIRLGLFKFRKAVDDESAEAGRSLGGIYGKPAGEALTIDNQVAEFYDPAVFQRDSQPRRRRHRLVKALSKVWQRLLQFFRLAS